MARSRFPAILLLAALSLGSVSGDAARPIVHEAPAATGKDSLQVATEVPASITGPAEAAPGRLFVLNFIAPCGSTVEIVAPPELDSFIAPDKAAGAFVAPEEGSYDFGLIAKTTVTHEFVKLPDGTVANLELVTPRIKTDAATFTVVVAKPKPPKPLSELAVPDADKLAALYHRSLAALVLPEITLDGWLNGVALTLHTEGLADNPAVPPVTQRLRDAGAAADWKAGVTAEVGKVVEELGGPGPAPPVVVEGKRRLVVLYESTDSTPQLGLLFTSLRQGEPAAYLKAKGHTLDVLDDDNPAPIVGKLAAEGVPEPSLFVLDGDGKMLAKQPLPGTAAEVLAVLKANGG